MLNMISYVIKNIGRLLDRLVNIILLDMLKNETK